MLQVARVTDQPCHECGKPAVCIVNLSYTAASSVPSNMQPCCEEHTPDWFRHPGGTPKVLQVEQPAWHDKPTCPGVWILYNQSYHTIVGVKNPAEWPEEGRRFYGPIPDDTQ